MTVRFNAETQTLEVDADGKTLAEVYSELVELMRSYTYNESTAIRDATTIVGHRYWVDVCHS